MDEALVQSALDVGKEVKADLLAEAGRITGITNPNSVPQLAAWLSAQGVDVPDLRKDTVAELLKQKDLAPPVRRMLEIRRELGKTSTKKYDAITACLCPDGRVRGLLQFYGASRSGRWAGRLIQMQNLPRTHLAALDLARELTRGRKTGALKLIYGNVPDTLSQLIRTAFIAAPGHRLVDADFSAIEARVLSWLAGEEWRLEVFRTHGKIYEASASQMFKVPIERIKKGNPEYELRAKGKVAELALGYQGSEGALISMGALDMGLTEQELPGIVSAWRSSNSRIRNLWGTLQTAAERVLRDGGHQVVNIEGSAQLVFRLEHDRAHDIKAMSIRLPSGRKLYYVDPQMGENRFGGTSITYMGVSNAKKWTRLETYGGKLVENCTQAIARDALAEAIERLEAAGYPIIFHIHDEVVIDIEPFEPDEDMLRRVVRIMAAPMPWAPGLPLNADGWVGDYFTKD